MGKICVQSEAQAAKFPMKETLLKKSLWIKSYVQNSEQRSFLSIDFKSLWLLPNYCKFFNYPWLTYFKLIIGVRDQNLLTGTKCGVYRHLPREFGAGFACDSTLSSLLNSPGHTFDLCRGDENSMVYLAYISPLWLPVPSSRRPWYTHYPAHRVHRQFGFDHDVPPVFKEVVPALPSLDPFLILQAWKLN